LHFSFIVIKFEKELWDVVDAMSSLPITLGVLCVICNLFDHVC